MMKKFTSRKFLAMVAGVAGGITLICTGNVVEGAVALIAAVVTYICAEANIDKAALKKTLEDVAEKIDEENYYSENDL